MEAAGASELRVEEDEEGRATVFFRLEASNERGAMKQGSDITLAALAPYTNVRWITSGVSYWLEG